MKVLEKGKLKQLLDKEIDIDEGDGYIYLHDWLTQKVTTQGCVAVFPYSSIFPTEKKIKKINIELFNSFLLDPEILNDKRIVFWPSELKNFSFGRPQDIILGKEKTTTLRFLYEIKQYLLNYYPDRDYWITIIGTDIHIRRILRDFQEIFGDVERRVMVTPYIIKIDFPLFSKRWFLKEFLRTKEILFIIISSLFWKLYSKLTLK